MSRFNAFIVFLIFLFIFLLIQQSGIAAFQGIKANLILVGFVFLVAIRIPFSELVMLLLALLFYAFFEVSLAFFSFAVCSVIILLCFFLRRFLTGRFIIDFFLLILFSTISFFYGLPFFEHFLAVGFSFSGVALPSTRVLFIEFALNLVAAAALATLGNKTKQALSSLR